MYLAVLDVFIRLITKNDIVFDIKPHTINNGTIYVFNMLHICMEASIIFPK